MLNPNTLLDSRLIINSLNLATRLLLFYVLAASCTQKAKQSDTYINDIRRNKSPFDLSRPSQTLNLEKKLAEISGLTHDDEDNLWCINDEKGNLYQLDNKGQVQAKIHFGKDGDYESLAHNNGLIYISKSNGTIKVADLQKKRKITEHNTGLDKQDNVEGLYYSKKDKALLIASKTKNSSGAVSIYGFDLKNKKIEAEPKFTINLIEALDSLVKSKVLPQSMKENKIRSRVKAFGPSGISQDPISQKYYITSSRGRLLTILDDQGKVEYIHLLDEKIFRQPEGISFDSKGNLFISNEARGRVANVLIFERKQTEVR